MVEFDEQFFIGTLLSVGTVVLNSSGNVLFKFHERKKRKSPEKRSQWGYVGLFLCICSGFFDIASLTFIPLSVNALFSTIKIPLSEIFSMFILDEKLSQSQWFIILLIVLDMALIVLCGNHSTGEGAVPRFQNNFYSLSTLLWMAWILGSGLLSGIFMLFRPKKMLRVAPLSFYNILGPYYAAMLATVIHTIGKLGMEYLKCSGLFAIKDCPRLSVWYGACLVILPALGIIDILTVKFIMAKLNIVTVIPLYGTFASIFPMISGVIFFREKPVSWAGFLCSIIVIVILNLKFISLSQETFDENEKERSMSESLLSARGPTEKLEIDLLLPDCLP